MKLNDKNKQNVAEIIGSVYRDRGKIPAIKALRVMTNLPLRDAKHTVEDWIDADFVLAGCYIEAKGTMFQVKHRPTHGVLASFKNLQWAKDWMSRYEYNELSGQR